MSGSDAQGSPGNLTDLLGESHIFLCLGNFCGCHNSPSGPPDPALGRSVLTRRECALLAWENRCVGGRGGVREGGEVSVDKHIFPYSQ